MICRKNEKSKGICILYAYKENNMITDIKS